MSYTLLIKPFMVTLYGSLAIHGYGIALCAALITFTLCVYRHMHRLTGISFDEISSLVVQGLVIGIIGARALHVMVNWKSYTHIATWFYVWEGGLAILGGIACAALYIIYALPRYNIHWFPLLDIAALYAPLGHAIGKWGCLWAGCCFGCPCAQSNFMSVLYCDQTSGAPMGVPLVAVQLYSVITFLVLFVILYLIHKRVKPGVLFACYAIGLSMERFFNDFWRGEYNVNAGILSCHQWIALIIATCVVLALIYMHFCLDSKTYSQCSSHD